MARDVSDLIANVSTALDKGDEALLEALLQLWKSTRSPRVADAIQRLGQRIGGFAVYQFVYIGNTKQSEAQASVRNLTNRDHQNSRADDPRTNVAFALWIQTARWPGSGGEKIYTTICEHLVSSRDVRAIEALRRSANHLPAFTGVSYGERLVAAFAAAADQLEQTRQDELQLEDPEEAKAIASCMERVEATLEDQPAQNWFGPPPSKSGSAEMLKTVEAVWANPDDDDTRRVVADALLERGEPWGEFIVLQLRIAENTASQKEVERAATLLRKHAHVFGGPIAKIAKKDTWKFEKGFLVACAADKSMVARRDWEDAVTVPHWSTVRTMTIDSSDTPKWWITEWLKNPATRFVRVVHVGRYKGGSMRFERDAEPEGSGWRVVKAEKGASNTNIFTAFIKGLSQGELERLVIDPEVDAKEALEKALAKARQS